MPPKNAYPKNPRPAFKPPRPVASVPSTTATKAPPATKSTRPVVKPTRAPAKKSRAALAIPSDVESDDHVDENDSDMSIDVPAVNKSKPQEGETLPPKLIARLLHESFTHDDTRINNDAMDLFTKYIEIFATEAIARAINERRQVAEQGLGGGRGLDFLEVEDLEKLAPQLIFDF